MWNWIAVGQLERHAKKTGGGNGSGTPKLDSFLADTVQSAAGKTPTTAVDENARRAWAKAALEATRKRAEGWRNGAAATLALVLASLAIKPGEGLMKYQGDTRTYLMLLVGASIAAALNSVYRLTRAANGPAWLLELPDDATADRWIRRAAGARLDLQVGQQLWVVSIVLFAAAVGYSWLQT